jgi:hypothetical protein
MADALFRPKVVIDGFHKNTLADEVRQLIKKDCKRDVTTSITMAHRAEPDRVGGCFYAVVACATAADADLVVTKMHNRRWANPRGLQAYPYASLNIKSASASAGSGGPTPPLPKSVSTAMTDAVAATATAAISAPARAFPPATSAVDNRPASIAAADINTFVGFVGQTLPLPKSVTATMSDRSAVAAAAIGETEGGGEVGDAMAERDAAVARAVEALRIDRVVLATRVAAAAAREAALSDREEALAAAQAASAALVAELDSRSASVDSDRAQLATRTAAFESREAAAAAAAVLARAEDSERKAQLDQLRAALTQRVTELDAREAALQAIAAATAAAATSVDHDEESSSMAARLNATANANTAALISIETTARVLIADLFSDTASVLADLHLATIRCLRAGEDCVVSAMRDVAALEAARAADARHHERALAALQSIVTQREADIVNLQCAVAEAQDAATANLIEMEAALPAARDTSACANERQPTATTAAAVNSADAAANAAAAAKRLFVSGTAELFEQREAQQLRDREVVRAGGALVEEQRAGLTEDSAAAAASVSEPPEAWDSVPVLCVLQ